MSIVMATEIWKRLGKYGEFKKRHSIARQTARLYTHPRTVADPNSRLRGFRPSLSHSRLQSFEWSILDCSEFPADLEVRQSYLEGESFHTKCSEGPGRTCFPVKKGMFACLLEWRICRICFFLQELSLICEKENDAHKFTTLTDNSTLNGHLRR